MRTARDELNATLASQLADHIGIPLRAAEEAVTAITADWRIVRQDYPHRDDHPLSEVSFGHCLVATLPFVPEGDDERADRAARDAARHWAAMSWVEDFDPMIAANGGYDSESGPPPARVGIGHLLQQGLWWRARMNPDSTATEAIRLADMTHSHRLALLAFLRRNAPRYKMREDWMYVSIPGPQGEMAQDAFEAECDRQWNTPASEWLEDQPLVRALVHWTTPVAESPLTWRPMGEAPRDGTDIMVRWPDGVDLDESEQAFWSRAGHCWYLRGGSGSFQDDAFASWRELRDDELPTPVTDFDPNCSHGVPDDEHCGECCEDC